MDELPQSRPHVPSTIATNCATWARTASYSRVASWSTVARGTSGYCVQLGKTHHPRHWEDRLLRPAAPGGPWEPSVAPWPTRCSWPDLRVICPLRVSPGQSGPIINNIQLFHWPFWMPLLSWLPWPVGGTCGRCWGSSSILLNWDVYSVCIQRLRKYPNSVRVEGELKLVKWLNAGFWLDSASTGGLVSHPIGGLRIVWDSISGLG